MFINEFSSSSVKMNHESGDSRNARRGLSRRDRDDLVRNDDNESSVDEIGNVSRFHSDRNRPGWYDSSSQSRSRNYERRQRSSPHPSTSGRRSPDYRSRSLRQIPKYQDLEVEGRRQNTRRQSNTNYYEYLNSSKQGLDRAYENRLVERNPSNVLSVRIDLPHKSQSSYGGENATYTLPRKKKNQFPEHQSSLPRGPPTNKKPKIEVKEFDFFEIKQSKSSDLVAGDNSSDKQSRKFKFERITFNSSSSNCEIKVKTKPSLKDVTFGDSSHSSEQKKVNQSKPTKRHLDTTHHSCSKMNKTTQAKLERTNPSNLDIVALADNRRQDPSNLVVRNLNKSVTKDLLFRFFREFGEIKSYKVATNELGKSMGFGYVRFKYVEDMKSAVSVANDWEWLGRRLVVEPFLTKRERLGEHEISHRSTEEVLQEQSPLETRDRADEISALDDQHPGEKETQKIFKCSTNVTSFIIRKYPIQYEQVRFSRCTDGVTVRGKMKDVIEVTDMLNSKQFECRDIVFIAPELSRFFEKKDFSSIFKKLEKQYGCYIRFSKNSQEVAQTFPRINVVQEMRNPDVIIKSVHKNEQNSFATNDVSTSQNMLGSDDDDDDGVQQNIASAVDGTTSQSMLGSDDDDDDDDGVQQNITATVDGTTSQNMLGIVDDDGVQQNITSAVDGTTSQNMLGIDDDDDDGVQQNITSTVDDSTTQKALEIQQNISSTVGGSGTTSQNILGIDDDNDDGVQQNIVAAVDDSTSQKALEIQQNITPAVDGTTSQNMLRIDDDDDDDDDGVQQNITSAVDGTTSQNMLEIDDDDDDGVQQNITSAVDDSTTQKALEIQQNITSAVDGTTSQNMLGSDDDDDDGVQQNIVSAVDGTTSQNMLGSDDDDDDGVQQNITSAVDGTTSQNMLGIDDGDDDGVQQNITATVDGTTSQNMLEIDDDDDDDGVQQNIVAAVDGTTSQNMLGSDDDDDDGVQQNITSAVDGTTSQNMLEIDDDDDDDGVQQNITATVDGTTSQNMLGIDDDDDDDGVQQNIVAAVDDSTTQKALDIQQNITSTADGITSQNMLRIDDDDDDGVQQNITSTVDGTTSQNILGIDDDDDDGVQQNITSDVDGTTSQNVLRIDDDDDDGVQQNITSAVDGTTSQNMRGSDDDDDDGVQQNIVAAVDDSSSQKALEIQQNITPAVDGTTSQNMLGIDDDDDDDGVQQNITSAVDGTTSQNILGSDDDDDDGVQQNITSTVDGTTSQNMLGIVDDDDGVQQNITATVDDSTSQNMLGSDDDDDDRVQQNITSTVDGTTSQSMLRIDDVDGIKENTFAILGDGNEECITGIVDNEVEHNSCHLKLVETQIDTYNGRDSFPATSSFGPSSNNLEKHEDEKRVRTISFTTSQELVALLQDELKQIKDFDGCSVFLESFDTKKKDISFRNVADSIKTVLCKFEKNYFGLTDYKFKSQIKSIQVLVKKRELVPIFRKFAIPSANSCAWLGKRLEKNVVTVVTSNPTAAEQVSEKIRNYRSEYFCEEKISLPTSYEMQENEEEEIKNISSSYNVCCLFLKRDSTMSLYGLKNNVRKVKSKIKSIIDDFNFALTSTGVYTWKWEKDRGSFSPLPARVGLGLEKLKTSSKYKTTMLVFGEKVKINVRKMKFEKLGETGKLLREDKKRSPETRSVRLKGKKLHSFVVQELKINETQLKYLESLCTSFKNYFLKKINKLLNEHKVKARIGVDYNDRDVIMVISLETESYSRCCQVLNDNIHHARLKIQSSNQIKMIIDTRFNELKKWFGYFYEDDVVVVASFDESDVIKASDIIESMSTKDTFQCDENIAKFVTRHCSNRFHKATFSITDNGVEIKSDGETVKTVKLSLEKIEFFTRTVYFMGPALDGFFTSDWIETSDDIEQKLSCVMMVKKVDDVEPEVGQSSIVINVCQDDITNQTTDAIVNGVGDDFNLNWGKISPVILARAGTDIAYACSSDPLVSTPYVRATKAGNLSCKYIFHMVTPTSCDELTERIRIVLDEAEKLGVKSISFPTLGAGGIGLNPKDVAEAMKKAFVDFKTQNLNQFIEVIRVVVFEVRLKGDFDFLTSLSESKPKKNFGRSMEIWSVLITGDDLYRLIAAGSRVSALRDSILEEEEEENILHLEEHDLLQIDEEAHSCKVHCTLSENGISFKITGLEKRVKRMQKKLNRLSDEIEEASTMAEAQLWKWKTDGENEYLPLPLRVSHRMVKHHKKSKNEIFRVNVCGEEISFNFATKTFQSSDSSKSGSIISSKAEEKKLKLPAKWEDMQDETFRLCILPSNSQEYRDVKQQFNKSNPSCSTIVSIERVQNSELYSHYRVEKKNVTRTIAGSNPVKRNLFHGTSKQDAEKICRHGFNRSYAGKNATMYGRGTYFARDSSYSVNYANSDFTGNKQMFLAKVVTGNYTQGSSSYIAPPQQSNGKLYDSVVDSSTSPSIFVVFTDHKAYPAYLITFR